MVCLTEDQHATLKPEILDNDAVTRVIRKYQASTSRTEREALFMEAAMLVAPYVRFLAARSNWYQSCDEPSADGIVSAVMLRLPKLIFRFDLESGSAFASYLAKAVENLLRDMTKKARRIHERFVRMTFDDDGEPLCLNPEHPEYVEPELAGRFESILDTVYTSPIYQHPVYKTHLKQMTEAYISGLSEGKQMGVKTLARTAGGVSLEVSRHLAQAVIASVRAAMYPLLLERTPEADTDLIKLMTASQHIQHLYILTVLGPEQTAKLLLCMASPRAVPKRVSWPKQPH